MGGVLLIPTVGEAVLPAPWRYVNPGWKADALASFGRVV